jgi:hypothetical protein
VATHYSAAQADYKAFTMIRSRAPRAAADRATSEGRFKGWSRIAWMPSGFKSLGRIDHRTPPIAWSRINASKRASRRIAARGTSAQQNLPSLRQQYGIDRHVVIATC